MKHLLLTCIFILALTTISCSQNSVSGSFPSHMNQMIVLNGFEGLKSYPIDSVRADHKGNFKLHFNAKDFGIGHLVAEDGKAFVIILAPDENLSLKGETLADAQSIRILSGLQNQLFDRYVSEHIRREQALSAWDYLTKIYSLDTLFSVQQKPQAAIADEINRIRREDEAFLQSLDPESYLSWYLPLRKLVSDVPTIAQYRTHEIPASLAALRSLDYTDQRFYKSGLLGETIEAHFWLIENSGRTLDSVYIEMNHSIDLMVDNLSGNSQKFNEITQFLFNLLEKRSLFTSSEYLALKVLNLEGCALNNDLASQLESYRAMRIGNTAPDFAFADLLHVPRLHADTMPKHLSDIKSDYVLVVFGAAWCPACNEELSTMKSLYPKWKKLGVEVIFVSLDTDKTAFENFTKDFLFLATSDLQKWESPTVKDWHIFATPTFFLINNKREILLKPNSTNHMDAWVNWNLSKTNNYSPDATSK